MFEPLYVAATGLSALEEEMSNVTSNLANAKTLGYKRSRTEMESLFYVERSFSSQLSVAMEDQDTFGTYSQNLPIEFGTGVRVAATPKDFSQGQIEITNNPLDLSIHGDGFFQVRMPDGSVAFTRAGNFHRDNEGNMVDPNGHVLEPQITFPSEATSILIKPDGTILVSLNNANEMTEIGQISIARFYNPEGLKAIGQNLFTQTASSGEPTVGFPGDQGYGKINQYSVESSNVDIISEMMRMVMVQRVFDTVTKAVQSYEGMLSSLQQMKQ